MCRVFRLQASWSPRLPLRRLCTHPGSAAPPAACRSRLIPSKHPPTRQYKRTSHWRLQRALYTAVMPMNRSQIVSEVLWCLHCNPAFALPAGVRESYISSVRESTVSDAADWPKSVLRLGAWGRPDKGNNIYSHRKKRVAPQSSSSEPLTSEDQAFSLESEAHDRYDNRSQIQYSSRRRVVRA